ncbi:MAG TPA: VanZ family protein [Ideonella sp.]|nr:VanZ family protein [Ideonella sp.]
MPGLMSDGDASPASEPPGEPAAEPSGAMGGRHRSSAVPLALVFAGLIVYASLYPFAGWFWPAGAAPTELLALTMPRWRIPADMWFNFLGYLPLGALLYGAGVRSGGRALPVWLGAVLLGVALSYAMEVTQQFLPRRYPSLLDLMLNGAGTVGGATLAAVLQALRVIDHWQAARNRWFIWRSGGALALMLLWPVGLLFPAPMPLGLGPGWERLQGGLVELLTDVAWAQDWLLSLEASPLELSRLVPMQEGLGVMLGLLGPCLLAFSVTRPGWRRAVLALGAALLGFCTTTLSAALNFGPGHALAWLTPVVWPAFIVALAVAAALLMANQRLAATLGIVVLSAQVMLVAQAPADPYFADSLQAWEQGRFIRFHGLAQWVGWLWPLAAIAWLAGRVASPRK